MANAGADIFMILLRPTRVPVAGEAVSHLFQGQVLIESLSWKLQNEDERKRTRSEEEKYGKRKTEIDQMASKDLRAQFLETDRNRELDKRNESVQAAIEASGRAETKAHFDYVKARTAARGDNDALDSIERAYRDRVGSLRDGLKTKVDSINKQKLPGDKDEDEEEQKARDELLEELDRNPNFEFTFTKRVDIATTQMLNSMKAGDVFPSGTLTIHKRSATVMDGTSLVFTIQKIRLLDYKLLVVVDETMTEMMEEWTCEFGSLAYVYKNPPSHYSHGNAGQAAIKSATQNTMRAFTMKNIGSPI